MGTPYVWSAINIPDIIIIIIIIIMCLYPEVIT